MAYYRLKNKSKEIDNVIVEIDCGVRMFALLIQTFKHRYPNPDEQTPARFDEWINSDSTPYAAKVFSPPVVDWEQY